MKRERERVLLCYVLSDQSISHLNMSSCLLLLIFVFCFCFCFSFSWRAAVAHYTSYVRCAERHNAKWMRLNELTRRDRHCDRGRDWDYDCDREDSDGGGGDNDARYATRRDETKREAQAKARQAMGFVLAEAQQQQGSQSVTRLLCIVGQAGIFVLRIKALDVLWL